MTSLLVFLSLGGIILFGIIAIYLSIKEERAQKLLTDREEVQKQRLYELAILREIQDRIGYELDIEKVADVITGSLINLFPYATSSSLLIKADRLIFKTYAQERVSHVFVEHVKKTVLASLSALSEQLLPQTIEEVISGLVPDDTNTLPLGSFFNIPLIIDNEVVGLINISSTKPGLYKEDQMTILYQITNLASNDITRLKQVLKNLEQMKDDFTNMMVHELRAPLNAIRGASSLMQKSTDQLSDEEKQKLLGITIDQSTKLLHIVGDILDAAKLESGKFVLQKVPTDVKKDVEKSIALFQSSASDKHITLTLSAQQALPLVPLDPLRFAEIMNNLLSNALQFTPQNGKILVSLIPTASAVVIAVSDSGIGIPEDKQAQLFSKFYQVKHDRVDLHYITSGTGLGLYIVKGIVEAHGGTIGITSTPGQGATFSFTIPLATVN